MKPSWLRWLTGKALQILVLHVDVLVAYLDGLWAIVSGKPQAAPAGLAPRQLRTLTPETQRACAEAGWQAVVAHLDSNPMAEGSLTIWHYLGDDTKQLAEQNVRRLFLKMPPLPVDGWTREHFEIFGRAVLATAYAAKDATPTTT